jgi:hypothetical protein
MSSKANIIGFTGLFQREKYYSWSYQNKYRNLMVLLNHKNCPEDFGQYGELRRCGTSLINISDLPNNSPGSLKNQQNSLSKIEIENMATRLSCRIQIDKDLKKVIIKLFDNIYR